MILNRVGLLAVDSSRTRAYLTALQKHDLLPAHAIYLTEDPSSDELQLPSVPYFDNSVPALEMIRTLDIPCELVLSRNVNSRETVEAVQVSPVDVLIYSGPGGVLIQSELFDTGKQFLHVHPGLLPEYRGSTTIYYSLLMDGTCGASALFLNERIDGGAVLATKTYPAPDDRSSIDHGYDPYIRSNLLVQVLGDYQTRGKFCPHPQNNETGETYFVMHPVLRHLAILGNLASDD